MDDLVTPFERPSFVFIFSDCYCHDLNGGFFPPSCVFFRLPFSMFLFFSVFLLVLLPPVFSSLISIPVSLQCFPCGELTQSC